MTKSLRWRTWAGSREGANAATQPGFRLPAAPRHIGCLLHGHWRVAGLAHRADHTVRRFGSRRFSGPRDGRTHGTIVTCRSHFPLPKYQTIRLPWPKRRILSVFREKRWPASARLSRRRLPAHRRAGRSAGYEGPIHLASTRPRRSVDEARRSRQRLHQCSVR
jgi:hypothetical protein